MRNLLILLSFTCFLSAHADDAPKKHLERLEHAMGEDRIVAGERAQFSGAVGGDLILAGGDVITSDPVGGDLIAAGGNVLIDSEINQDLYSAGGRVTLNGVVKRNARLAGGQLEIGNSANITGNATLAGGSVNVLGAVQGQLAVAGGRIYLNGRVDGNVDVTGGEIELGPRARISGDLRYRSSSELKRAPDAEVRGTIAREPVRKLVQEQARVGLRVISALLFTWAIGLMIVGAVLVAALPGFTARLVDTMRTRPGVSLLLGFAALVATPAAAAIFLATVIGIPLGLLILTGYLAILMLGYASAGVALGQMALQRLSPLHAASTGWRAGASSLAILIITLLSAIPFLGWLVWLAVLSGGTGMLLLQLRASTRAG